MTFGFMASARAMAARCCSARLVAAPVIATGSAASGALAAIPAAKMIRPQRMALSFPMIGVVGKDRCRAPQLFG